MKKRSERHNNKKRNKFNKIIYNIAIFILAQILVGMTFSFSMVYYGPFVNIRETLVTTAMTTLSHQYIVTKFLSKAEIDRIMEKNKIIDNKSSDEKAIETIAKNVDKASKQRENSNLNEQENAIEHIDISNENYKGHLLIIKDPLRVKVGTTSMLNKQGMKVDEIVKRYGAQAGINGGGFEDENGHGTGGVPLGVLVEDGKVLYGKPGEKNSIIGLNDEGVLVLGKYTLEEIKRKNIKQAISFAPFLIVDGEPMIKTGNGGWGYAPRTAIGQRKDGAIVMLVIDGRQLGSIGATLKDVQDIMLKYDVYNAANLDGGSSTTMVYEGKIINNPSSKYGPRYIPSAFIVK